MWTIFKVPMKFATVLSLFYALALLAIKHTGSQFPDQGSDPRPLY